MNIDKYIPPPPPLPDTPFRLPFYGGFIIPKPRIITKIEMKMEDVAPIKAKPRRIRIRRLKRYFLFFVTWNKEDRILHIFIPMFHIEIPTVIGKPGKIF